MCSIISRYIGRNLLTYFGGILFVLLFVIFMGQFSRMFTYALRYGASLGWVAQIMLYMLPDILVLSIPIAFQISILMTLTALSQSGEVMALRAAGLSFFQIARPVLAVAIFLSALLIYFSGWLSPIGRHKIEEAKEDIVNKITKVNLEARTFINLGDWDIFAQDVNKKKNTLTQISMSRKNDDSALSTKINAQNGKVRLQNDGIELTLSQGQMQRLSDLQTRKIITADFDKFIVFIPLSKKAGLSPRNIKAVELTTPQILEQLKNPSLSEKDRSDYKPEPAFRLSFSLAPLIFFLLSCPVAFVITKKAGRAAAMGYSILFLFGYFGLLTVGGHIGESFSFAPVAYGAPLLPVIVGGFLGRHLWRKRLDG